MPGARILVPTAGALRCRAPKNPRPKTTFRNPISPDTLRKTLGRPKAVSVPPFSLEGPKIALEQTEKVWEEEAKREKGRLTGENAVDAEEVQSANNLLVQGQLPRRVEGRLTGLAHLSEE